VSQTNLSTPPILGHGTISIASFLKYEYLCMRYFAVKNIAVMDQVSKITHQFNHEDVAAWIALNWADLELKSFLAFMVELCKKFLPYDWDIPLAREIQQFQNSTPFAQWFLVVHITNAQLIGSPEHRDDTWLCSHFCATMDLEFCYHYNSYCLSNNLELEMDLDKQFEWTLLVMKTFEEEHLAQGSAWV
ncbi:hypothetical protein P691DRAFT_690894, partial [Macrolepiota fuliginosa MF-IS2]